MLVSSIFLCLLKSNMQKYAFYGFIGQDFKKRVWLSYLNRFEITIVFILTYFCKRSSHRNLCPLLEPIMDSTSSHILGLKDRCCSVAPYDIMHIS